MSQAHRPTWNPTQGRETKAGSQRIAKLSLASHKKLKFRQPGQQTTGDIVKRDLKAELAAAERVAQDKKRKAAGLPPLPPLPSASSSNLRIENGEEADGVEDESVKRRKILEEAAELDKDDDSDDEDAKAGKAQNGAANGDKGKGKAAVEDEASEEEDDDSDDDSDEDDTAELMAELAKIKQERAEEKAKLDAENAAAGQRDREEEIATGNPLLNLQAALGQTPGTPGSTTSSAATFTVKRRWDDDLIFKNQAAGIDERPKRGDFVNDLLRSEFHKKFMNKFIK